MLIEIPLLIEVEQAPKTIAEAIQGKTENLPASPASTGDLAGLASAIAGAMSALEENIRGEDNDNLKGISDQIDGVASGRSGFVLPVMQGRVYTAAAHFGREVKIAQLTTPRISFQFSGDFTGDYSGWSARFGAKRSLDDEDYVIPLKENITLSYDQATNTTSGLISLDKTDTAEVFNKLYAEIEINKDDNTQKPYMFYLTIYDAVIR